MGNNGFSCTKNNDYYNSELGIILEDLHDENVLTQNGMLYFIDTVFYIVQPLKNRPHFCDRLIINFENNYYSQK